MGATIANGMVYTACPDSMALPALAATAVNVLLAFGLPAGAASKP